MKARMLKISYFRLFTFTCWTKTKTSSVKRECRTTMNFCQHSSWDNQPLNRWFKAPTISPFPWSLTHNRWRPLWQPMELRLVSNCQDNTNLALMLTLASPSDKPAWVSQTMQPARMNKKSVRRIPNSPKTQTDPQDLRILGICGKCLPFCRRLWELPLILIARELRVLEHQLTTLKWINLCCRKWTSLFLSTNAEVLSTQ